MFEDPAFPSMPPPGQDASVKPMSLLAAAMWACGAQLMFLWTLQLVMLVRGPEDYDLISGILCQLVGYGLCFYLLLRVYGPETRIRDFAALRHTNPWFYPLGLGLGLSSTLPTYYLLELIHRAFPPGEEESTWLQMFTSLGRPEQIAVAIGTVFLGPFVEELIFRGALFRPLQQKNSSVAVVVVTAFLFAGVHLDLHRLAPLLCMGALLGFMRLASGSLAAPLLLHIAFNAVPFVELFGAVPTLETLTLPHIGAALGACVVLVALTAWVAARSRRASSARRED